MKLLKFNRHYFLLFIVLLIVEIYIAIRVHDDFIRPYIGDLLVVMLLYCFIRSFIKLPFFKLSIAVLLFSYFIELLQYVGFVKMIGLQHSKLANTLLGNSFSWTDIIAYTVGAAIIIVIELGYLKLKSK